MRLYFVRHGERDTGRDYYNPALRHQDNPLSELGNAQAKLLPDYFAERKIEALRISAYLRTALTAEPLAAARGLRPVVDARLNEIDNGVVEGLGPEELAAAYPEFWAVYAARNEDYRFPGGENGAEVKSRQDSLLRDLVEAGEDAVLVCHEGYIRLLLCNLLGMPLQHRHRFRIDFCSVTELEYDPARREFHVALVNRPLPGDPLRA